MPTHNRSQLIAVVARRAAVSQHVAGHVLDAVFEKIDELTQIGPLTIRGFGRFEKRHYPEREGRSPLTGETVMFPARTKLVFKAATQRG